MSEFNFTSAYRVQIKYHCAVPQYTLFDSDIGCERLQVMDLTTIEWTDVVNRDVLANNFLDTGREEFHEESSQ